MPDRLLKLAEVKAMCGIGTSNIYARMKDERFPKPCRLSESCVRWRESDIQAWIAALPVAEGKAA